VISGGVRCGFLCELGGRATCGKLTRVRARGRGKLKAAGVQMELEGELMRAELGAVRLCDGGAGKGERAVA
jgi:hypothetical protein